MEHPSVTFITKDGRSCTLRPARGGDGESIVETLNLVAAEGIYLASERARWTPAEMEEIIAAMDTSPFILIAAMAEKVIGHAFLQRGTLQKNRHTAGISMLVIDGFREIGIGTRMMEYAEQWARREGLHKLYLSVFSTNRRAYNLYCKAGYTVEGRRREQFCLNGTMVDEVLMGKILTGLCN